MVLALTLMEEGNMATDVRVIVATGYCSYYRTDACALLQHLISFSHELCGMDDFLILKISKLKHREEGSFPQTS